MDLIRRAAAAVIQSGEAQFEYKLTEGLDIGMVFAELIPRNPHSAKLGIQIDGEDLVTLYFGRYQTLVECFSSDSEKLHEMLTTYTKAVINGEYEEWIRFGGGTADGAIAELHIGQQRVCIRYNTLVPAWWARRRWQHVVYKPYSLTAPGNK